jgi:hypothetical protein
MGVIVAISKWARVFATAIHFHPSLIFADKAGVFPREPPHDTPL